MNDSGELEKYPPALELKSEDGENAASLLDIVIGIKNKQFQRTLSD